MWIQGWSKLVISTIYLLSHFAVHCRQGWKCFVLFCFLWYWGLNPGPPSCSVSLLHWAGLQPQLYSVISSHLMTLTEHKLIIDIVSFPDPNHSTLQLWRVSLLPSCPGSVVKAGLGLPSTGVKGMGHHLPASLIFSLGFISIPILETFFLTSALAQFWVSLCFIDSISYG